MVDDSQRAVTEVQAAQVLGELHVRQVRQGVARQAQPPQVLQVLERQALDGAQGVVGDVQRHQAELQAREHHVRHLAQAVVAQVQAGQARRGGEHLAVYAGEGKRGVRDSLLVVVVVVDEADGQGDDS